MNKTIIHKRLRAYADWAAASHGFRFGPGADQDIEQMTLRAVENMFGPKPPKRMTPRHAAMIAQAEASLAMLVAGMVEARASIRGYAASHPDEIGEQTLGEAMSKLCPLFPIC